MAPAKSPSAHQLSCPACESHSCGSHGRAGKLTAAVCPPQLEPRRASSRTRRDKEKQGCRSCGETFNSITKRKHHCKLCGAVSPAAEASMCLLPPLHLPSVHTDPPDLDTPGRKAGPGGLVAASLWVSALWTRLPTPQLTEKPFPSTCCDIPLARWPLQPPSRQSSIPGHCGHRCPLSYRSSVGSAPSLRLRTADRAVSAESVS